MQLAHITDLHFGCEDKSALDATARFIAERKPDAVIVTGDISRDGLAEELQAACDWIRTLAAPALVTPGNHDVPYYNPLLRLIDPWGRFLRAAEGLQLHAWHHPTWSVLPINTARGVQPRLNWAQGGISGAQVRKTRAELAKAAPGALRIVATHHPLNWPNDAPIVGRTWGGPEAEAALVLGGADVFLCGHLHFGYVREIGAKAIAVAAGTLSQRVRHEPCGFAMIGRTEEGMVEVELVQVRQGVAATAVKRSFSLGRDLKPVQAPAPHPIPDPSASLV